MIKFQEELLSFFTSKQKTIALLAPSFPIDFSYPEIILMLRKLGFDKVTEITFGARMTNYWHVEYVKSHPDQKYYITGPCPTCLALIKARYPELLQYVIPYASPVVAEAKIIKKEMPDYKTVFFAPCQSKQLLEWPKHKDTIDLVLTFKELQGLFDQANITQSEFTGQKAEFDSFITENTKIYPVSGGLARSAMLVNHFPEEQIWIGDGPANVIKVLDEAKAGTSKYRFFDILNCPGGCIGGPGLSNSGKSIEEKTKMIEDYCEMMKCPECKVKEGKPEIATDIDFKVEL